MTQLDTRPVDEAFMLDADWDGLPPKHPCLPVVAVAVAILLAGLAIGVAIGAWWL